MASLVITNGEQSGTYFQLVARPLTAGRDPAREIQLKDPKVSRRHFQVRMDGDDYLVVALKSLNGVLVNGEKVADEQVLTDGDRIQVGDTTLTFQVADDLDRSNALMKHRDADRHLREDRTLG